MAARKPLVVTAAGATELAAADLLGGSTPPIGDSGSSYATTAFVGAALGNVTATGGGRFPTIARSLADRAMDHTSLLEYLPPSLRTGVLARTNTVDLSGYINQAIQDCPGDIELPSGDVFVTDLIQQQAWKRLVGQGVNLSRIVVGPGFNLKATSILQGAPYAGIDGIGIVCDQSAATSRATLVQYPWALDLAGASRYHIGHLRISAAWLGVNADQGSGGGNGFDADIVEIGAFSRGILLDNIRDFCNINAIDLWPWDFGNSTAGNANTLLSIFMDGLCIGAEIGTADGLELTRLDTFAQQVVFDAIASTAGRHINSLHLDSDGAIVTFNGSAIQTPTVGGSPLQIDHINSTKGLRVSTVPSIRHSGGKTVIGKVRTDGNEQASQILVTGGLCVIGGGALAQQQPGYAAAEVTGGTLKLDAAALLLTADQARTKPFISQSGTGVLMMHGCDASPISTAANDAGSGLLVALATDNPGNAVSGNSFGGWGYSPPPAIANGIYGPNGAAPIAFTPSVTFQTPGDWAPTYAYQKGFAYLDAQGYRFEMRLRFTTNAYTSPSGAAEIVGLPYAKMPGSVDQGLLPIGASNVTLSTGYSAQALAIVAGGTFGYLYQMGSAKAATPIGSGSLPPSTNNIDITVSGYVPVR